MHLEVNRMKLLIVYLTLSAKVRAFSELKKPNLLMIKLLQQNPVLVIELIFSILINSPKLILRNRRRITVNSSHICNS